MGIYIYNIGQIMDIPLVNSGVSFIQLFGAFCFGGVIGWYVYLINRHRTDKMQMSDLVPLIAVIGGGVVIALFPASSDLFGAYAIGLACGFFFCFMESSLKMV